MLIAPSIEDPPGDHEVQKQVDDSEGVHPVDPSMRTGLQHFTYAPSTPVIPRARMIEIRTDRYSNAPID